MLRLFFMSKTLLQKSPMIRACSWRSALILVSDAARSRRGIAVASLNASQARLLFRCQWWRSGDLRSRALLQVLQIERALRADQTGTAVELLGLLCRTIVEDSLVRDTESTRAV